MEPNGRSMESETHTAQEPSNAVDKEEKDEELEIIDDGSNPYKKVKVNVKGESKKKVMGDTDKETDIKGSEGGDQNKGEEESEAMKNLVQEIRKKKKKSKKKEKTGDDDDEGDDKEKKKKAEKKEASKKSKQTETSGEREGEEKEKKKKKKKREKEEDDEKEKKKKNKKKKEMSVEDQEAKEKERKKKKKKEKALEAYQKKFQEFEKKYPHHIQKGKIKFPIEDVLFKLYDTILSEHLPKTKKPTPKNGLIPMNELGDILEIWNFYKSFIELFSFKNIQQEEIYACLKYTGDEHLYLIDAMHREILIFFVKDFIKKNKFETFRDEVENPFFVLVKYYAGYEGPQSEELTLIWTELLRRMANIHPFTDYLIMTVKKYIGIMAETTTLNYNKVEYKIKTKVLLETIKLAYESETFRDCIQEKMDQATGLSRERNELLQEIKQEELEYYDLKAKVEVSEKAQKEEEEKWEQLSRTEVLRRQKDFENEKKELQKTLATLAKVEASLQKKRKRVEEINFSANVSIETATRVGMDGNKSEYWIFTAQPERLYVKISPLVYPEDTWRYFDQKEELDTLLDALNTKGINEKHLAEKLREAVANKHLALKSGHSESEATDTAKAEEELDMNYWYAKILEYTSPSEQPEDENDHTRTTRQRAQEHVVEKAQKKRPKELKYLTIEGVKEIMNTMEEHLTEYLAKWNARWAHPKIKEELKRKIKEATTVKELTELLLELEKNFQYSEAPLRQKTMEEEANPEEGDQDDYEGSEEEDEEDYDEEDNRSENEENYYGEDDKRENRRRPRKKSGRMDEEEDEQNGDEENEEEKSEEEARRREEEKREEDVKSGMGENQEQNKEEEKDKQNGNQAETEPQEKVKKMSLKIWGRVNERIRRCWVAFTRDADNITSLFLCASIFSEFVENYLEKKRLKYFAEYDNIAQYMAAKREKKQNVASDRATSKKQQNQQNSLEKLKRDREIRRENYALGRYAAQHHHGKPERERDRDRDRERDRERERDRDRDRDRDRERVPSESPDRPIKKKANINREPAETHAVTKPAEPGPKRIRKLREQSSEHSESEAEYEYNPKNDEKSRTKQEKLNELANVRRSTRVTRRARLVEDDEEEEYQEYKECAICRRGGDLVQCAMCENAYHLDCVGLKNMPEDKWTCFDCLKKLVSQRQTRSTTRRLH